MFSYGHKEPYIEQNKKLRHSSNYRAMYFEHNPGLKNKFYFCPYCGKVMWNKDKITIDHIYSVRYVQVRPNLRKRFSELDYGVNSISNLTSCCKRCNSRKGSKGGLWIIRGKYGKYFMSLVRLLMFIGLIAVFILLILQIINYGGVLTWLQQLQ